MLWQVSGTGWPHVVVSAGRGLVAVSVPDLDGALRDLAARGIRSGPVTREGEDARKAVVPDPEGNSIAFIEVSGA